MKSVMKAKHVFAMALLVSIFIGYVGLVTAKDYTPTITKPDKPTQEKLNENYGKLPLSFIQNDGQMDEKVKYYERGSEQLAVSSTQPSSSSEKKADDSNSVTQKQSFKQGQMSSCSALPFGNEVNKKGVV